MATYQIHVNERIAVGKSLLELLRSLPEAVSFETPGGRVKPKRSKLYADLDSSLHDVKEIMTGKQPRITLDAFLDEIRDNNN
jgi:hypothetical protein